MNQFLALLRGAKVPVVIAHRGASALAPENTILAAEVAWRAGAVAWEFDVQLTRDDHPVVLHDESLKRTTDVARRFSGDEREKAGFLVSDFTLDEVRSLDAGAWFLDRAGTDGVVAAGVAAEIQKGGVRIPSLEEALRVTAAHGKFANVELKTFPNHSPKLLDLVKNEVDRLGITDRVLVSSFDHGDVQRAAGWGSSWATGVLSETPLCRPADYVRDLVGADCLHCSAEALGAKSDAYRRAPGGSTLRSDVAAELRGAGVPLLVYTVNDAGPDGLARHLSAAGVSALFSDDPGAVLAALGSSQGSS